MGMRLPPDVERRALELAGQAPHFDLSRAFSDEDAFQAWVVTEAKDRGWKVYHTYNSRKSKSGFLDLVCWRERLLLAELKMPDGVVGADQATTIEELRAAGQEVYLWYPADWETILQTFTQRGAS